MCMLTQRRQSAHVSDWNAWDVRRSAKPEYAEAAEKMCRRD